MKLYATTTSERASKGQGGNDRLDIEVLYGSKAKQLKACSVYIKANDDDTFTMTIIDNTNSTLLHTTLKGEKKKGECANVGIEKDGFGLCGQCNQFHNKRA